MGFIMNRHENTLHILVTHFIYHPVFFSLSGVLVASEYYLELAKEYLFELLLRLFPHRTIF